MGLAPCLVVTLLAVHHVAGLGLGAPRPVSSLDAKQQEIVDFAVVQLQVSCPVKDMRILSDILSRAESTGRAEGNPGWRNSANRFGASDKTCCFTIPLADGGWSPLQI